MLFPVGKITDGLLILLPQFFHWKKGGFFLLDLVETWEAGNGRKRDVGSNATLNKYQ
jgi:hypothetical protein